MSSHLLKAVVHAHTAWSPDASMSPAQLIERCLDHGVDILAVTDHNEVGGAFETQRRAPFQVIVGEEVRTAEGGEVIGLFLTTLIPKKTPVRETIRRIKDQGGLVYLPHPFDSIRSVRFSRDTLEEIAPDVDIVETFNARNVREEANRLAKEYARTHGKATSSGADAHLPTEIGRTVMMLLPFSSPQELLVSLKSAQHHEVKNPLWVHVASQWHKLTRSPSRDRPSSSS